ncbi:LuxR family transcriptional regulator [Modestobacter sp. I12A-02628]|uniref:LuxR family transcriptional regulator n=1 Tax=Goekera deserti TaxID=2497753 RepID=A0A7K3WL25_9ACTN|nr:LuxR family transcriptional regulator [Goekera deserti]MPQ96700.1 LuxR family transcriptional regulator [Goekera deserti]NDI46986.1 LuxR family transcriptional regulator [Goekera deserti]NEL56223.1 LuxR family transcriptional regulator [Goekera deserti]
MSGRSEHAGHRAERTVLVVDLDGEFLPPLATLEELLCALATWESDDEEDPPLERQPLQLPAPLAGQVALGAVQRLIEALTPTQSLGPEHGRLLAPDGSHARAPLSVLVLPLADIRTLSLTAQALGNPGLDRDVAGVVDGYAHTLSTDPRHPVHRTELVSQIARVAGLLDLADTEQTQLLVARLSGNPPGRDLALTRAEEAAYDHTADRMNAMWGLGSPATRIFY